MKGDNRSIGRSSNTSRISRVSLNRMHKETAATSRVGQNEKSTLDAATLAEDRKREMGTAT